MQSKPVPTLKATGSQLLPAEPKVLLEAVCVYVQILDEYLLPKRSFAVPTREIQFFKHERNSRSGENPAPSLSSRRPALHQERRHRPEKHWHLSYWLRQDFVIGF